MVLVDGIETRQVASAMARINALLDDVKTVTGTVKEETELVNDAINTTIGRIDDTAIRMRSNLRAKTRAVGGLVLRDAAGTVRGHHNGACDGRQRQLKRIQQPVEPRLEPEQVSEQGREHSGERAGFLVFGRPFG
jgi:hypothetical protein